MSRRTGRWQAVLLTLLVVLPAACSDSTGPGNGSGNATVDFSQGGGFYAQGFALSLSTPIEGGTIYYTVDGSTPDPARVMDDSAWEGLPAEARQRTFVYDAPIDLGALADRPNDIVDIATTPITSGEGAWVKPPGPVQMAVPVRAWATSGSEGGESNGATSGAATTHTYFIVPEGRARYSLPVISLTTDRTALFASDVGIYVPGATGANYEERGEEWERTAHFELFDVAGQRPLAQDIGVRIHGGWTRRFAQKSLRLYSRSDYGTSRFNYRFFPTKEIDDFNRLLLRNAGNDWGRSMFRDGALQTLVQHLPFASQHYQPAILFINGEYWGIHNIRDRLDQHYVETHYGVDRDDVVILEGRGDVTDGEPGDEAPYHAFLSRVRGGELASFADFDAYMDVAGYLDYVIVQWYAANTDWPENNVDFWRYKGGSPTAEEGPRDGRWRWMLYDVDRSFGLFSTVDTDMATHMLEASLGWSSELFRGLLAVPEIRNEFLQRMAVHLSSTFRTGRVQPHIDAIAQVVEVEMPEHARRWSQPASMSQWNEEVNRMRAFAAARPDNVRGHVVGYFGDVQGTADVTIGNIPSGGGVALHTVELSSDTPGVEVTGGQWEGTLFTGVPVVLTSTSRDLSRTTVSGGAQDIQASADEVRFVLTGSAQVTLN